MNGRIPTERRRISPIPPTSLGRARISPRVPTRRILSDGTSQSSSSSRSGNDGSQVDSNDGLTGLTRLRPALLPNVANFVSRMELTRPEVLRVARAYKAFSKCAEAFRPEVERQLHHNSRTSERIERFWSHSWHGGAMNKILTLLVLYNSQIAVCLGSAASLLMTFLFSMGFLPGLSRVTSVPEYQFSSWSLGSGFIVSMLSFVLWRPQQLVFFDRLCISESDPVLKTEAILSLAGMLKRSTEMLVLWDSTWSDRLWCLFELAAFLQCNNGARPGLMIRPTFLGPCSIAAFLTTCIAMIPVTTVPVPFGEGSNLLPVLAVSVSVANYLAVVTFRRYFESVEACSEKLRASSFETVRSACCEKNHSNSQGRDMICDREVVKECINIWWGSQEAFEDFLHSEVLEIVASDLQQGVFTSSFWRMATAPVFWTFLDMTATAANLGWWDLAAESCIVGLVLWLLGAPMWGEFNSLLTRTYCRRASSCFGDIRLNVKLVFATSLPVVLVAGCIFFLRLSLASPLLRAAMFVVLMMTCSVSYRLCKCPLGGGVPPRSPGHAAVDV